MKGYLEMNMGGKKRPLKFGTNSGAILCELRGINLKGVQELLNVDKLSTYDVHGDEIRDTIYSALVAAARSQNIEVDFNQYNVGDWIDELSGENILAIITVMSGGMPEPEKKKNRKAKAA